MMYELGDFCQKRIIPNEILKSESSDHKDKPMEDESRVKYVQSGLEPDITPMLQPEPAAQLVPLLLREHPRGHGQVGSYCHKK